MIHKGSMKGGRGAPIRRGKTVTVLPRQTGTVFCLWRNPGQQKNVKPAGLFGLADPEHLRAACWTNALGCRPSIFHCDCLRVFHFSLGFTLYAISFHRFTSSKLFK
jgi:hypothetical protein